MDQFALNVGMGTLSEVGCVASHTVLGMILLTSEVDCVVLHAGLGMASLKSEVDCAVLHAGLGTILSEVPLNGNSFPCRNIFPGLCPGTSGSPTSQYIFPGVYLCTGECPSLRHIIP